MANVANCALRSKLRYVLFLCVYVLLFLSILDIYYTSPLVTGVEPVPANIRPIATHVILIVLDGMRAETLFSGTMDNAPYIKELILHRGRWGVSRTRAPTESRPGHAALLGGFFEDVSAVRTGWKINPVAFDSPFNRTWRAWGFGSDYILHPYLSVDSEHVHIISTPPEVYRKFFDDSISTDKWALDQLLALVRDSEKGFFAELDVYPAGSNVTRRGNLAFLHFDSVDNVGHHNKPGTPMFNEMLKTIDGWIKLLTTVAEHHANLTSSKVAFVLTSDHGTVEDGGHGGGSRLETETVFVAWGSGITKPVLLSEDEIRIHSSKPTRNEVPLHFVGRARIDLDQIDICALTTVLLGASIPVNSLGRVPMNILDASAPTKYQISRLNCMQLLAQLKVKIHKLRSFHFKIFFWEYRLLKEPDYNLRINEADHSAITGQYTKALEQLEELKDLTLKALDYYHTYDRPHLQFCIVATFVLLSMELLFQADISREQPSSVQQFRRISIGKRLLNFLLVWTAFKGLWCPAWHTIIQLLPLGMALYLMRSAERLAQINKFFSCMRWNAEAKLLHCLHPFALMMTSVVLLELLTRSFYDRRLLTFAFIILASWPIFDLSFAANKKSLRILWAIMCLTCAVFPSLPNISFESRFSTSWITGIISTVFSVLYLWNFIVNTSTTAWYKRCYIYTGCLYCTFLAGTCFVVGLTSENTDTDSFSHIWLQWLCWIQLILLPIFNLYCLPSNLYFRIFIWSQTLFMSFMPLCIDYEGLFFTCLIITGWVWLHAEFQSTNSVQLFDNGMEYKSTTKAYFCTLSDEASRKMSLLRRNLIFMSLILMSLFGTTDLLTFRRFDLASTRFFGSRYTTSNHLFAAKLAIPILYFGLVYTALIGKSSSVQSTSQLYSPSLRKIRSNIGAFFVCANFVAVHFFFWLEVEGSWLEIGMSITRYGIGVGLGFASIVLILLAHPMLILPLRIRSPSNPV